MNRAYVGTPISFIQRFPLTPPVLSEISSAIRARLLRTANILKSLPSIDSEWLVECLASELGSFRHELSGHFKHVHISKTSTGRTAAEFEALKGWRIDGRDLQNSANFVFALTRLNRILVGGRSAVRSGQIGTAADKNGLSIRFPHAGLSKAQIDWLRAGMSADNGKASQLLCAIASLPILTNSHLFTDGNGRVSRVFFNHILHRIGLPPNVYLPVYEIMTLSQGGFLIRLRLAEIQNLWEPFISFMLNFIDLSASAGNDRWVQHRE